jgi:hypothetical protein
MSRIVIKKLNSVDSVRERTIPTERPPVDGEVSANFFGERERERESVAWPVQRIRTALFSGF